MIDVRSTSSLASRQQRPRARDGHIAIESKSNATLAAQTPRENCLAWPQDLKRRSRRLASRSSHALTRASVLFILLATGTALASTLSRVVRGSKRATNQDRGGVAGQSRRARDARYSIAARGRGGGKGGESRRE